MERGAISMVMMMVVLALGMAVGGVSGQQTATCANDLIPCLDAVTNTTMKPGSLCCGSLKKAMTEELTCLCNLYNTPSTFVTFKVNKTRALEIPGLCGLSDDLSRCTTATSVPSPASSGAPTPTSGSDKQNNGALRSTWFLKACMTLFTLWVSVVA